MRKQIMLKKFKSFERIVALFTPNDTKEIQKRVILSEKHYVIREITIGDIKELLSIEREVYLGEMPWTKSAFLLELKASDPHLYIIIQDEEKIVGFIGCRIMKRDGHITNLAVRTEYQGRGIGSCLLQETKIFAKRHNCKSMSLEVRLSNNNAQRLYRRNGFTSFALRRNYYDEDNEDAVEMVLNLDGK